jgi:hypothetical protein
MKTYIVYAERRLLEVMTVEATSEEEALDKAMEADNSEWQSETDVDWQITRVEESE